MCFDVCCIAAKLVPLAYGIKKLQISCVVEDDKVSTDDLEEQITAFEDYVRLILFVVIMVEHDKIVTFLLLTGEFIILTEPCYQAAYLTSEQHK